MEDMNTEPQEAFTYEYFERIIQRWYRATGAHQDNVRGLFIKAAIAINASPYTVALVAEELLPLVQENFKMSAMERPKE